MWNLDVSDFWVERKVGGEVFTVNGTVEAGVLVVIVDVKDVGNGGQNAFNGCAVTGGVGFPDVVVLNVVDLDVTVVFQPNVVSFNIVAKSCRVFVLKGEWDVGR